MPYSRRVVLEPVHVDAVQAHVNITADRLPSRDVRFVVLIRSTLSQEGLVFAGGDDFVRPVVDARATIESEPVVRKSSEVLRLVDDAVDAALILT